MEGSLSWVTLVRCDLAESGRLGFIMFRNYISSNIQLEASSSGEGLLLTVQDSHLGLVLLFHSEIFLLVEVCLLASLLVARFELVLDVLPHRVTQEVYGLLRELLIFVGFQASQLLLVAQLLVLVHVFEDLILPPQSEHLVLECLDGGFQVINFHVVVGLHLVEYF